MRKLVIVLLAVVMISSLSACYAKASEENVESNDNMTNIHKTNEVLENDKDSESENTLQTTNGSEFYSNKVYSVGEDIPAGGYVINCTDTEHTMFIAVFTSETDYENFNRAKKATLGEFREAIELNAWTDFYLEKNEKVYIGLKKGYLILLDDGLCEFNAYEPSVSKTLYPGIYVCGEDIEPEKINILCTSEYMQVTLFSDQEKYLDYHRTSRFTYGEEKDAIAAFSDFSNFFYTGESTNISSQIDMILMVEEGIGECSIDEGPIINPIID